MPTDVADGLQTLGAQVALALEAAALTEDLSRQRSEAGVAALVQNSSDMIMVLDFGSVIRYVTPSVGQTLGHRPDELVGTSLLELVDPAETAAVAGFLARLAKRPGGSLRREWRMRCGDGRFTDVEAVITNLIDHPSVNGIVVTAHDITERKALELGLQRQVRELEELDRIRNEFLSTVSHELRTPLTSIIGEIDLFRDGDLGELSADQERGMEVIDRNSIRLLRLIEDLLTLSQIETRAVRLQSEPTVVAALVEEVRDQVWSAAAAKELALEIQCEPETGTVVVDRDQVGRALLNLVTNAVKFTPTGGTVVLRAWRECQDLVITVSDTGLGIPEAEQDRLFTRFFRSSVASRMAIQGTGLGLVIAKQIVEEHGGTISIRSTPDIGTIATIRLPAGTDPRIEAGAGPETPIRSEPKE